MTSPGLLVREARRQAGLTVRELARRADVAASTVSRIESGRIDPGVHTLTTILDAAGHRLQLESMRRASTHLSSLSDAWSQKGGLVRPDWTRLRALLDRLHRHPDEIPDAIAPNAAISESSVIDSLLAGIAEKLADDAHQPRPAWTAHAPALSEDYFFAPGTARMLDQIRTATPAQLARRRVMVDGPTLWRETAPTDA